MTEAAKQVLVKILITSLWVGFVVGLFVAWLIYG